MSKNSMKRLTDPSFRYVPSRVHESGSDYLRNKFRKMMREIEAQKKAQTPVNVTELRKKK